MQTEIDLLAQNWEKKYDPTMFIGRLSWYSIPESIKITHDDFSKRVDEAFKDIDLKLGGVGRPRAVDVFKRGCTNAQLQKYIPTDAEKVALLSTWLTDITDINHLNFLIRPAGSDESHVWRVLVRETVDTEGHEIGFDEVAKIQYNRTTSDITITKNDAVDSIDVEDGVLGAIREYFIRETTIITPYAVREWIRKGLEGRLHATKVRPSGGIYYTLEDYSRSLGALKEVVNGVGGSFHTLPLIDDSDQRKMVRAAFEDESVSAMAEMMDEIREILKSGKTITSDRFADFKVRFDTQRVKIVEYSDVLDEAMDTSTSYLELAEAQIRVLADKVNIDEDYH